MRCHRAAAGWCIAVLVAILVAPAAALACEGGTVFLDRNGDDKRDGNEPGIAGVRVSDGEAIVETDADGRYPNPPAASGGLFLIKPAGYIAPRRGDGLPATWSKASCHDFALLPQAAVKADAPLEVLLFGDPQPKSTLDVGYYRADIVGPLRNAAGGPGATLALTMGDLVNDVPSLYPALKRVDAALGIPWLHAPGNHDVDPGDRNDDSSLDGFHAAFGPDTFAWEEARANFVVLDDTIVLPPGGKPYVGGFRPAQFAFLEAYLAKADPARLLVLAFHIPLFDVGGVETFRHADRARLFALLARFPHLLVVSAHTHGQQHVFHGADSGWTGATPLHEYNVGAACGSYWTGRKDAHGIPSTTMADGTPNGYARLRVGADGNASLRWFAARAPRDAQMTLHAPKVLRKGAWPGFAVYANVWMGQADTPVEYRIDGGEWQQMVRVLKPDPAVVAENLADDAASALRSYDRLPEAEPSTHLWRGALPTSLALGKHAVEVRAQLDGFGSATANTSYELRDAAP